MNRLEAIKAELLSEIISPWERSYADEDIHALLAVAEAAMAVADNAEWGEVDMQGEFYFVRPEVMEALRAALAPLQEPE